MAKITNLKNIKYSSLAIIICAIIVGVFIWLRPSPPFAGGLTQDVPCQAAGDETQFSTPDGYLQLNQYAPAEAGFIWTNRSGVVRKEPDTADVSGLSKQSVVGMRYWKLCDINGVPTKDNTMTQTEYFSLPTAQGIKTTVTKSISRLLTDEADAAISFGAVASARNSTGTSLTIAFTCNAGNYIAVGFDIQDSNQPNTVILSSTYGGTNLKKIVRTVTAGNNTMTEIWDGTTNVCNGTAQNLVSSTTGAVGEFQEGIISLSGTMNCPRDNYIGKTGNSNTPSVNLTPIATGSWTYSAVAGEDLITGFGTQTKRWSAKDQGFENGAGATIGPVGNRPQTLAYTLNSGQNWSESAIDILPGTYTGVFSTCGGSLQIKGGQTKIQ